MPRKRSEVLAEEMTVLRSEIQVVVDKGDEATEEDLSRSEACLVEWDDKKVEYDNALARETKVDAVMRASFETGNREGGATGQRRGPEVMRRVDPYTTQSSELLRRSLITGGPFDVQDAMSRAKTAVDGFNTLVTDESKQHVHQLLDMDNHHSERLARHILMASSDAYQAEFKEYVMT